VHGHGTGTGSGSDWAQAEQPAASSPALQEGDAFGPTLQQASAVGAGKKARSRLTELKEDDDRSSDASIPAATLNGSASRQSLAEVGGEHSHRRRAAVALRHGSVGMAASPR
jgi:hypothetical protein